MAINSGLSALHCLCATMNIYDGIDLVLMSYDRMCLIDKFVETKSVKECFGNILQLREK